MSGKTTAMVLAGAGLLVFLVILKQSIGSSADPPVRSDSEDEVESDRESPAPATGAQGRRSSGARVARIPSASGASSTSSGGGGGATSEPAASEPPAVPFEKPVKPPPIVGKPDLHAQVAAVAPLVQACIERTPGKKDGTAALSFVVAPKGTGTAYSAIVESSAYDDSGTTIQNEALVDCLHQTAMSMKFTPYAPDADAVVARRELVIEDGKLVSDRFVDYSYIRR